ncbi:carboxylating nicotinate-nucleotide diphosphorylase [Nocardioides sp.]|jgi:nicotinate-nucleotide pyrophosphorylase (carboxylating)|uniref:carboxylating nicotinate-nucleotide diphosphorylase n=1 Tax=Nocardioides sp. TaxID=35761 RepID=UPI0019C6BF1A|nr:carboxylating nicotinate-nucleotide diphosphorylase [Nocardioides sp.]MBC7278060.1 carboxylating nicotinate-nucleotide diphosphorylase [Nocardioides sp.]
MTIRRVPFDEIPQSLRDELTKAGLDAGEVYDAVELALDEDLPSVAPGEMPSEDVTSVATIAPDAAATGVFAAREDGVVAGLGVAELVFAYVMGDSVTVTDRVKDGSKVKAGDVIMRIAGPTRGLLTAERTALNYASHLSGVATGVAAWTEALEGTGAQVLDTRKTLPGFRALEKYAVRCGGGANHRMSLSDMALVKDNHIVAAGGAVQAYEAVRFAYPDVPVEVEVTTLEELEALLDAGCGRIMLDNMSTAMMKEAVGITAGRAVLEASGGLTLDRAREVAETGVDYLSVGALTHSVKVFDIGFDLSEA